MRLFPGLALPLVAMLITAPDAFGGWNNVFQTTCCKPSRSSASFSVPVPEPSVSCYQTQVTYVQRSYCQAYTAYRQEVRYEPVTSTYTSYYYEPVRSTRYTSYYDPCTGCTSQVAQSCTSYVLRSKCNTVQSYVQRCQMVPYTAYRTSYYMEPVVTYSPPACPSPCETTAPAQAPGLAPGGALTPNTPRPGISSDGNLPPQGIQGSRPAPRPQSPAGSVAAYGAERPLANGTGRFTGAIVAEDRISPRGGAKLIFSNLDKRDVQVVATADAFGRFSIDLPAGEYTLFLSGGDGQSTRHSEVTVKEGDQRNVKVVSR